jgi:hypothetical protein
MGFHGLLRGQLCYLIYDICTSQETHLRASTACYGDSFTFLLHLGESCITNITTLYMGICSREQGSKKRSCRSERVPMNGEWDPVKFLVPC